MDNSFFQVEVDKVTSLLNHGKIMEETEVNITDEISKLEDDKDSHFFVNEFEGAFSDFRNDLVEQYNLIKQYYKAEYEEQIMQRKQVEEDEIERESTLLAKIAQLRD